MTNLSNELCDICGLKYCKEKVVINNGQTPNVDIKPFYLDFEQPENFVKLFNTPIPNPYITISGFVTHYALSIWVTHDFLKRLVQLLKNKPPDFTEREIMLIKQAIKEREWVYE